MLIHIHSLIYHLFPYLHDYLLMKDKTTHIYGINDNNCHQIQFYVSINFSAGYKVVFLESVKQIKL